MVDEILSKVEINEACKSFEDKLLAVSILGIKEDLEFGIPKSVIEKEIEAGFDYNQMRAVSDFIKNGADIEEVLELGKLLNGAMLKVAFAGFKDKKLSIEYLKKQAGNCANAYRYKAALADEQKEIKNDIHDMKPVESKPVNRKIPVSDSNPLKNIRVDYTCTFVDESTGEVTSAVIEGQRRKEPPILGFFAKAFNNRNNKDKLFKEIASSNLNKEQIKEIGKALRMGFDYKKIHTMIANHMDAEMMSEIISVFEMEGSSVWKS